MTEEDRNFWLVRRAIGAALGSFDAPDDPFASWFGKVRVALPDEAWPTSGGKPMTPLCQFNLTELPYRPENLADIALITVFISQDELPRDGARNGDQWLLRAYETLDGLITIEEPEERGYILPHPIRWELIASDYPDRFEPQGGIKFGGWPLLIQGDLSWGKPWTYVFQIDSDPKANWSWGDAGVGYFGRGTGDAPDQWVLSWQCY